MSTLSGRRLERFSPLHAEPERFGILRREPERSYRYVYPERVDLDRVAYFFDYAVDGALPESTYDPLRQALAGWTKAWGSEPRPTLTYRAAPGLLQIYDARHPGRGGTYTFEGTLAEIYLACNWNQTTQFAIMSGCRLRTPLAAAGAWVAQQTRHSLGALLRPLL